MEYPNIVPGTFISRVNRFVARVAVNGAEQDVHVKNTGRLRELFLPGTRVFLTAPGGANRRTAYDLVALDAGGETQENFVNVDSGAPNRAVGEWLRGNLFSGTASVAAEVSHGDSRFDFYVEDGARRAFIEVKGVTLLVNGGALFPDAPTERGIKHVRGLIRCIDEGYEAYVLFIVQRSGADFFAPNDAAHPAFGAALREASRAGVRVLALACDVAPNAMHICGYIPVEL